jgi:hypothetical protein
MNCKDHPCAIWDVGNGTKSNNKETERRTLGTPQQGLS